MSKNRQKLNSRYRLIQELNKGGMGAVYEGFDNVLQASVAIKENLVEDASMREAFRREAQLLANLHHPALPHCSNFLTIGKRQYLVMEFIEGDNLATLLSTQAKPFPVETVMDWAWQMLDVLEYLHLQEILHRDIKPSNIKVKDGRVYLLDFGLAYGQTGEMNTIVSGDFNWSCHTRRYSSLEQVRSQRTYPASDLYSFGATLYKLLTNVAPDDAVTRNENSLRGESDSLEDIRTYNQEVDERTSQAIMRALSLSIEARPQSVEEMRQMLFPAPTVNPACDLASRPKKTRRLAGALAVCTVFALFIFGPIVLQRTRAVGPSAPCSEESTDLKTIMSPIEQSVRLAEDGDLLYQSGKDEEAGKKYDKALALDPTNADGHRGKGDRIWDAKGDQGYEANDPEVKAEANIILSLVRSPRSSKEFTAKAWAELQKGHLDLAIEDANKALSLDPNSVAALMIRASARIEKTLENITASTVKEALDDLNKVIRLRPEYAQARVNRGDVYFRLHLYEEAGADYARAVQLIPRANYHTRLGRALLELQNSMQDAHTNCRRALEINSKYLPAQICLGDVFFRQEEWSHAEDAYVAANRIRETSYAFHQLSIVYKNMNQLEKADLNYQRALDHEAAATGSHNFGLDKARVSPQPIER